MAHTKLYETLEISPNASEADIKKAYRKMAMKHHPDKGGDSGKFKEISAAFEILGNKEKIKIKPRKSKPHISKFSGMS